MRGREAEHVRPLFKTSPSPIPDHTDVSRGLGKGPIAHAESSSGAESPPAGTICAAKSPAAGIG